MSLYLHYCDIHHRDPWSHPPAALPVPSFPVLQTLHIFQPGLQNLHAIMSTTSSIFPSLSSLFVAGQDRPYDVYTPNLIPTATTLASQLSALTVVGAAVTDDNATVDEILSFLPTSILANCTSLRHLTLGRPQSSHLSLILNALPSPSTLESISLSYLEPPTPGEKHELARLVLYGQDPRERVEVEERQWDDGESIAWRGREEGKRFYYKVGGDASLLWEDLFEL